MTNISNSLEIEGNVKIWLGKKWKSRYCVLQRPSPCSDCANLMRYKSEKFRRKNSSPAKTIVIKDFITTESGFIFEKETHTLAVLYKFNGNYETLILAFEDDEKLTDWIWWFKNAFGYGCQYKMQVVEVPKLVGLLPEQYVRLHIRDGFLSLVANHPPNILFDLPLKDVSRYRAIQNRFCFSAGQRSGRLRGLYHLLSGNSDQIELMVAYAAEESLHRHLRAKSRRPVFDTQSAPTTLAPNNNFSLDSTGGGDYYCGEDDSFFLPHILNSNLYNPTQLENPLLYEEDIEESPFVEVRPGDPLLTSNRLRVLDLDFCQERKTDVTMKSMSSSVMINYDQTLTNDLSTMSNNTYPDTMPLLHQSSFLSSSCSSSSEDKSLYMNCLTKYQKTNKSTTNLPTYSQQVSDISTLNQKIPNLVGRLEDHNSGRIVAVKVKDHRQPPLPLYRSISAEKLQPINEICTSALVHKTNSSSGGKSNRIKKQLQNVQACSCCRRRRDYINQNFIDSLQSYFNIDAYSKEKSKSLTTCCHNQHSKSEPTSPAPCCNSCDVCKIKSTQLSNVGSSATSEKPAGVVNQQKFTFNENYMPMSPACYEYENEKLQLAPMLFPVIQNDPLPASYVQMTTNQCLIDYIDDVPRSMTSQINNKHKAPQSPQKPPTTPPRKMSRDEMARLVGASPALTVEMMRERRRRQQQRHLSTATPIPGSGAMTSSRHHQRLTSSSSSSTNDGSPSPQLAALGASVASGANGNSGRCGGGLDLDDVQYSASGQQNRQSHHSKFGAFFSLRRQANNSSNGNTENSLVNDKQANSSQGKLSLRERMRRPVSGNFTLYDGDKRQATEPPMATLSPLPEAASSGEAAAPLGQAPALQHVSLTDAALVRALGFKPLVPQNRSNTEAIHTMPNHLQNRPSIFPRQQKNVFNTVVDMISSSAPNPINNGNDVIKSHTMPRKHSHYVAPASAPVPQKSHEATGNFFKYPSMISKNRTLPRPPGKSNNMEEEVPVQLNYIELGADDLAPIPWTPGFRKSSLITPTLPKPAIDYAKIDEMATQAVFQNVTARAGGGDRRDQSSSSSQTWSEDSGRHEANSSKVPSHRKMLLRRGADLLRRRTSLISAVKQ